MTSKLGESKLQGCLPTMTALLAALVITLNGVVCGEATAPRHQCEWCGPLTELVHRRARAQPCGPAPPPRIVTCEPPYAYCATIATAPPYSESRMCVKEYQEACYPLFCNTSSTWKMVCPCKGDLCNSENTQREIDAFHVLTQLTQDTFASRDKRNTQDLQHENRPQATCFQNASNTDKQLAEQSAPISNLKEEQHRGADEEPAVMSMLPQSDQPAAAAPTEGRIVNENIMAPTGPNITAAAAVQQERVGVEPERGGGSSAGGDTNATAGSTTTTPNDHRDHPEPTTSPPKNNGQRAIFTNISFAILLKTATFIA